MSGAGNPARRNARLTLFAQLLNILVGSSFAAVVIAPLAVMFYAGGTLPVLKLFVAGAIWLLIAGCVHCFAQWVLRGIR